MDEDPAATHPDRFRPRTSVRDRVRRPVSGCARPGSAAAAASAYSSAASAAAAPAAASTAAAPAAATTYSAAAASSAAAAASAASAPSSSAASAASRLIATPTGPRCDASSRVDRAQRRIDRRRLGRGLLIVRRVAAQFQGWHLRSHHRLGTTVCTCRPRGFIA